jgi:ABC-type antimicrobial peptide transport system permease subunit
MMPAAKLARVVVQNTLRSPRHFILSVFGIVIGIGAFVFFLGLSMGAHDLLNKFFPIEQVEVVAPRASLMGKDVTKRLDDAIVQKIRAHPGVKEVVPRMALAFPASGSGSFDGQQLKFEVGGFADGVDPEEFAAPPGSGPGTAAATIADLFQDWDGKEDPKRVSCVPGPGACADKSRYYCDERDHVCHHRVPVLVSPMLLELYNGQFAKSHGLPVIGELEAFMVERGGLSSMRFSIGLGDTMVVGSNNNIDPRKVRWVEGILVGIHAKANPIGITIPIQYIERWNREFSGEEAASTYSSILVTVTDKDQVAPLSAWLNESLDLRIKDSMGERLATAIFIVTTLFLLISFSIVGISAINIAHNFFMQVSERRREIGLLRAIGATRADVRFIILGEAALIGVIGGLLGIVAAIAVAFSVDWASAHFLPRFPFKPDSYFDFQWWILAGGLAFSTIFCVLGGYLPALRASRMEPAQALAAQ